MPTGEGASITREIWRRLRAYREKRGISPSFASTKLGVDASTLYRNERDGGDLDRAVAYANEVLGLRLIIIYPEGRITLQPKEVPLDLPGTFDITVD